MKDKGKPFGGCIWWNPLPPYDNTGDQEYIQMDGDGRVTGYKRVSGKQDDKQDGKQGDKKSES